MSSSAGQHQPDQARRAKALRWVLVTVLAAMVAIGLVLLFLLTQATNNQALYEENYSRLFVVNMVVAGSLLGVIAWIAWRLFRRLRQGRFGSRLLVKLAAIFALAGFAPGMLIYVVSYQFVSRSIESWFDVKVEGALEAGLSLGRETLETLSQDLGNKTRASAASLQDTPDVTAGLVLERQRDQLGVRSLVLWTNNAQVVASSSAGLSDKTERPTAQQFRAARSQRAITWVEGFDENNLDAERQGRIKSLVLVPNNGLELLGEARFLLSTLELPASLVANAMAVTEANREYQQRALARDGLRRMYIGTLTLSLFLAVFGAVLLAVVLGNQIIQPMIVLADGVRQVAAGDLRPKTALQGNDELGGLTRSFADMTQQLADARHAVQNSMEQVSSARANLQTILDNLTAGVMVLDDSGRIRSSNPGATRILRAPLAAYESRLITEVPGLEDFGHDVMRQFELFLGERAEHGLDHWQQSFTLGQQFGNPVGIDAQPAITLVARGAELPRGRRLLVFDDISEIVSAQRAQAWGEVARRLAHEIKNPLTPIQLSAERLQMKLEGKLQAPESAVLDKSVKTIVDQVDAMKRLVNEFRDYARLPSAELVPLDLNDLVTEVLHLYDTEGANSPIEVQLDMTCPPILGDAQQLRQVIHNLIQNAQDATDQNPNAPVQHPVTVSTQWMSTSRKVRLRISDHGTGFPDNILKRAFEPYVTTKTKGTGLGLAVVKKIADEHSARIEIRNRLENEQLVGAQVSLSFSMATAQTAAG
jgi:nitrogen fixation/metabolism regulation signal transduction histidine kinase